jgi:peptidoglycan pentaglycine glycine transferase (the first glycine)
MGSEINSSYRITVSQSAEDDEWDNFVEFGAKGHFEQTSRWGQVKGESGWQPLRVVVYEAGQIVAGAQILLRGLPLIGRVGYLSRGPLVLKLDPDLLSLIVHKIKDVAREWRVRLLLAQAPQGGEEIDEVLAREGFVPDDSGEIVTATTCIDLGQGLETVLSRMTRNFRYNIRFAARNYVAIHDGKKEDIPLFFRMMVETCKRQGVDPNPASESHIRKLWQVFSERGGVKLFLALHKEEVVSGLIGIPFGQVFYAWKMGWTGRFEDSRANHLLHWEAIKWASNAGYRFYDFMALSRRVAETVIKGNHFYSAARGSALFKLSFGGDIILLPEARTYISNPFLKFSYRKVYPRIRGLRSCIGDWRSHLKNSINKIKCAVDGFI